MKTRRTPFRWVQRLAGALAGLYVGAVLGLALLHALLPQRAGLLAVSEIFAPYLFLPALVVCPLALLRGTRAMRAALLVCVAVFALRYLTAGLQDTYLTAGAGVGATWGPGNWASKWMLLLRIDYLFSSPNLMPLSTGTDCAYRGSDHCILRGTFALK